MERTIHNNWRSRTTGNLMEIYDHCWCCGGPTKKEWNILKADFAVAEMNRRQAVKERDKLKAELEQLTHRLGEVEALNNIYEDDLELSENKRTKLKDDLAFSERCRSNYKICERGLFRERDNAIAERDEARRWARRMYARVRELEEKVASESWSVEEECSSYGDLG